MIASVAFWSALPRWFSAAAFWQSGGRNQNSSTTRVRPSSNRSSAGCHPGRWSKPSGSGLEGFRGRLKRFGGTCIFVFAERCPKLSRVFGLQWLTGGPYTTVAKPLSAAWETAGQANHLRFNRGAFRGACGGGRRCRGVYGGGWRIRRGRL